MATDFDPVIGQWLQQFEKNQTFKVLARMMRSAMQPCDGTRHKPEGAQSRGKPAVAAAGPLRRRVPACLNRHRDA